MGGNGGTAIHKACGLEDSSEDMFNYLKMACGPQGDEERIRTYVEGSPQHFEWLTRMGVPYKESIYNERGIIALTDDCLLYTGNEKAWPFKEHAKPCPRGHNLQVEGDNGGPLLMKILSEKAGSLDCVNILYDTRALSLIIDNGSVAGLVIRKDMKTLFVKANKGVILCAGGFVMNEQMMKKYAPHYLEKTNMPIGNPNDTGAGINMGLSVGASTINMHECFVSLPYYPPSDLTYSILINSAGQRFINEDTYHGRVGSFLVNQPGDRIYMIVHASEDFKPPIFLSADFAGTGETIEELAVELGMESTLLEYTLTTYNYFAAKGEDPTFHKAPEWLKQIDPPYAALDCTPGRGVTIPVFTLGGLEVKTSGEVMDNAGKPIKGLYAAGRTCCGLPRTPAGYSSGMSVGDATFFGRLAGKTIATTD